MASAAFARSASDSRLAITGRAASAAKVSATAKRTIRLMTTSYVSDVVTRDAAARLRKPGMTPARSPTHPPSAFAREPHLRPFVPSAYNSHRSIQSGAGDRAPRETKMDNATTVGHVAHGHAHDEP